MPITALYAGLLAPLLLILTARVITMRGSAKIGMGHDDNPDMLRRIRVHGNFTEYAPFALLSIALAESLGATPLTLHAAGLLLVAGRYAHAFGMSCSPSVVPFRVGGMVATLASITIAGLACLILAGLRLFS